MKDTRIEFINMPVVIGIIIKISNILGIANDFAIFLKKYTIFTAKIYANIKEWPCKCTAKLCWNNRQKKSKDQDNGANIHLALLLFFKRITKPKIDRIDKKTKLVIDIEQLK